MGSYSYVGVGRTPAETIKNSFCVRRLLCFILKSPRREGGGWRGNPTRRTELQEVCRTQPPFFRFFVNISKNTFCFFRRLNVMSAQKVKSVKFTTKCTLRPFFSYILKYLSVTVRPLQRCKTLKTSNVYFNAVSFFVGCRLNFRENFIYVFWKFLVGVEMKI